MWECESLEVYVILPSVPFILSRSTKAVSHRTLESADTSRDSCRPRGRVKLDTLLHSVAYKFTYIFMEICSQIPSLLDDMLYQITGMSG